MSLVSITPRSSAGSSSGSTSRSSTPPPTKQAIRKATTVGPVGQEAPTMKVKTLGETPLKEDKLEEDPYGLKNDAQGWLEHDMKSHQPQDYRPLRINTDDDKNLKEDIKKARDKAVTEYGKRVREQVEKADEENTMEPIRPVLVAFGVSKKNMEMFHYEEALGSGRFLYFPTLNWIGEEGGALFLTYMAGPWHGAVDSAFLYGTNKWMDNSGLKYTLDYAANSGGYGKTQPDGRIYPAPTSRDGGEDRDDANVDLPYSRLYWECEHKNRNIIELRKLGFDLMNGKRYTRLFLGCKFEARDQNNRFEASIVLWGKPDGEEETIRVLEAISFGSKDIGDTSKNQWESDGGANKLPAVDPDEWKRPQDAGDCPYTQIIDVDTDPNNEWKLNIPFECLLYKVKAPDSNQYILDLQDENGRTMLHGTPMENLVINLKFMARKLYFVGQT